MLTKPLSLWHRVLGPLCSHTECITLMCAISPCSFTLTFALNISACLFPATGQQIINQEQTASIRQPLPCNLFPPLDSQKPSTWIVSDLLNRALSWVRPNMEFSFKLSLCHWLHWKCCGWGWLTKVKLEFFVNLKEILTQSDSEHTGYLFQICDWKVSTV